MGWFDFLKPKPKQPPVPPEALMVWVHRTSHFAALKTVMALEASPLNAAFALTEAAMTTDGPIPLTDAQIDAMGLTRKQARARAVENASGALLKATASDGQGLYLWQGSHAGLMVLTGSIFASQLPLKGRAVAMHPAGDLVVMAGADDAPALARMLDVATNAYTDSPEYRSLRALAWDDAKPVEWLPPEGHPLRTRFLAAAARTRRQEAQEVHHALVKEGAPLAHLGVTAEGTLAAGWIRDSGVVLPPDADTVVLIDTDDAPDARLAVPLAVLRDELPWAFEEIPWNEDEKDEEGAAPALIRARAPCFPSPRERAYLKARMAFDANHPEAAEATQVPAATLLAAWDAGTPVRIEYDFTGDLILEHPDRTVATVKPKAFGARADALSARDQVALQMSLLSTQMLRAISGDDAGPALPPGPAIDVLNARMVTERPELLNSLHAERLLEEAGKGSEVEQVLMGALARSLEPGRVFPMIRPPDYTTGAQRNELGIVAAVAKAKDLKMQHFERVTRPFVHGLSLELVSDRGDSVSPLDGRMIVDTLRAAAWRSALLNLDAASVGAMVPTVPGVFVGPWHDDYDASRTLLVPRLVSACAVKGTPLLFAPTLGNVWVTGADDVAGIGAVLDAIDAFLASGDAVSPYTFRQLLFATPWVHGAKEPAPWRVPEGHPHAARIAALDAELARRRASARDHVQAFATAAGRSMAQDEGEA